MPTFMFLWYNQSSEENFFDHNKRVMVCPSFIFVSNQTSNQWLLKLDQMKPYSENNKY